MERLGGGGKKGKMNDEVEVLERRCKDGGEECDLREIRELR